MTLTARCSASMVAKTPSLANTKTPTLAKKEADSCKYKHTFMQIQAQIWTYYNSIKSNQESIAGISSETLSKPFKLEWSWRKICTVSKRPQIHFECTISPYRALKMHFAIFDYWDTIRVSASLLVCKIFFCCYTIGQRRWFASITRCIFVRMQKGHCPGSLSVPFILNFEFNAHTFIHAGCFERAITRLDFHFSIWCWQENSRLYFANFIFFTQLYFVNLGCCLHSIHTLSSAYHIPYNCHFFYTDTIFVRIKFTPKNADFSR